MADISVHKDWVGGVEPYSDITLALQRRTDTGEFETAATEILPKGDHIHIWKAQPLTDEAGNPYEYRVIETHIGTTPVIDNRALFYTVSYSGDVDGGFTVTNTADNTRELEVTKTRADGDGSDARPSQSTLIAVLNDLAPAYITVPEN